MSLSISAALRRIKALKHTMSSRRARIIESTNYPADKPPVFSYEESTKEYLVACRELVALQGAVQVANATNTISYKGRNLPLCWAIAHLAEVKSQIALIEKIRSAEKREYEIQDKTSFNSWVKDAVASLTHSDRWWDLNQEQRANARAEIINAPQSSVPEECRITAEKHICELPVREREQQLESLREEFAQINGLLEQANHTEI